MKKEWLDGAGRKNTNAPTDVLVQLYRNDEKFGPAVTINKDDLNYTWRGLDKADNSGNNYTYTVKELDQDGNDVTDNVTLAGKNYKVTIDGTVEDGFTITKV